MIIIGCLLSYPQLFTVQVVYTFSVLSNLSAKNNTNMIYMHDYQIRDSDYSVFTARSDQYSQPGLISIHSPDSLNAHIGK